MFEKQKISVKNQNGNVLFLILIAVALFAALSYAVTQSTRSGGGSTKNEKAGLCVSQIDSMLVGFDTSILRIKARGFEDYQIDTASIQPKAKNGGLINNTTNTACNSDSCRLFSDKGGDFSLPILSAQDCGPPVSDTYYDGAPATGAPEFIALKVKDVGTPTKNSLAVRIGRLNRDVCDKFNKERGITNWEAGNGYAGAGGTSFSGPMSEFPATVGAEWREHQGAGDTIAGKTDFCYRADAAFGYYAVIHLLSVR